MTLRTSPTSATVTMQPLISAVRSAVGLQLSAAGTADKVATELHGFLSEKQPLPAQYRQPDPDHYVQHVLHAEPGGSFSIVALVWLPGQFTPIHDHVAWCVTGVAEGEEQEQRYTLRNGDDDRPYLMPTEQITNPLGDVAALAPPGDIHRVRNDSESLAVSLHVYGADISALGSSVRRIYDHPVVEA